MIGSTKPSPWRMLNSVSLLAAILLLISHPPRALSAEPATKPAAQAELPWLHTLKDGYAQALKEKKPILVVFGAEWCGPCKMLEKEMATPDAAKSLARWTRVHLDVDHSEGAAAMLQSGAIPLLRVLSPTGQRVDFKEGAMKAGDLIKWLDGAYDQAIAAGGEELLGSGAPDAASIAKLMGHLSNSDAAQREAAIKRLSPFPTVSAIAVTQTFAKGNLLTRLACLDLLTEWKASVADLDPWQPDSITPERLKSLADWAASIKTRATTGPATAPAALTPAQLEEAARELSRMLAATSQNEAHASRERLARMGRGVLPLVQQALAASPTENARERLLGLRYRLAATDALVASWPGGIERLASTDAKTRHAAAEELAARATADEGTLLLELFADSDALIREISLRGLQAVGKGNTAKALVTLLNDPDLNVRAAVLKQLAEAPSAGMLTSVIEFAQKEKDPDLVVHGIRVLRESKSDRAMDGLLALLTHANWRVRAEAAEALTEMTGRRSGNASQPRQAQVQSAFIKLLDDPDGFVVSRAVLALAEADVVGAIDAMAKAAQDHPELAGDIIRGMVSGSNSRNAAEKHLRAFCSHKDPQVRSAAIAALVSVSGNVETEMKALLKDDVEGVRMWAAASLFEMINTWRPNGQPTTRSEGGFLGFGARVVEDKNDPGQWAADFRANKNRPSPWLADLIPDLRKLTTAPGAETRLDGALPLLALSASDEPLEIIRAAVTAEPRLAEKAAGALPWVAIDARVSLFKQLAAAASANPRALHMISSSLAIVRDPKAAPALWELIAVKTATMSTADVVYSSLLQLYFGDRYYNAESAADDVKTRAVADAKSQLKGSELQRLIGMAILLNVAREDAAEAAKVVYEDPKTEPALRADAMQIRILAGRKTDDVKFAVTALASRHPEIRRLALQFLAVGANNMEHLRQQIYLRFNNREIEENSYIRQGTPVVLEPPPGVTPEAIKPLLKETDPATAAYAGYLTVLLGDRAGFDRVLDYWHANPKDFTAQRLVYRSAASLGDDELTPILEQIYNGYEKQEYYVREFYWTIRVISGEKVLKLRKRIRDEVGMEQLR